MLKSYKYRIYPTRDQEVYFEKNFGCSRLVYNLALQTKSEAYSVYGKQVSHFDLINQLVDLKSAYPFLKDVDSAALQESLRHLDIAFRSYTKKKSGFPKYKSKDSNKCFACRSVHIKMNWERDAVILPKIGAVKIELSRKFQGKIKKATISKTKTGRYFVSILFDDSVPLPEKKSVNNIVGIDLGIKDLIITSTGIKYENPKYLKNEMARLKVLQRRVSRKKIGGRNRDKANFKVAVLHEKISNKRLDFIHKVTSELVNDSQVDSFAMEDLNVKGMMSNHNLAGAIQDASWGKLLEIMKYKCDWSGKNLILINRFAPSSKTCSNCGNIKDGLTLADREYCCNNCGYVNCRDINAAINIKNFGKKLSGMGSPAEPVELLAIARAKKQESKRSNVKLTPKLFQPKVEVSNPLKTE